MAGAMLLGKHYLIKVHKEIYKHIALKSPVKQTLVSYTRLKKDSNPGRSQDRASSD
jgi:hypothetical protein